ncbi:hypothetical protein HanRHA438_Chr14g0648821 [Helianthus annuus]|nr:hypothetical protein HanRHA438_Chr14g0648821 [Helianthus annuus]
MEYWFKDQKYHIRYYTIFIKIRVKLGSRLSLQNYQEIDRLNCRSHIVLLFGNSLDISFNCI